uniref:Uncharacterized protein n=1 Tax=Trichogramma kaykai TaxID=54128 RepID=A0ABD2WA09_9HYME
MQGEEAMKQLPTSMVMVSNLLFLHISRASVLWSAVSRPSPHSASRTLAMAQLRRSSTSYVVPATATTGRSGDGLNGADGRPSPPESMC